MKKYFPILLSKAGELKALKMISEDVRERITPIIQVLKSQIESIKATFIPKSDLYDELFLDFSLASDLIRSEIENLIQELNTANINVIPVIQSDLRTSTYLRLIKELLEHGHINVTSKFTMYKKWQC